MSVLFVAFRLEIAQGSPVPQFDFCNKGVTKSYAEVTARQKPREPIVHGKDLARYRGRRKFTKYIIETYMAESLRFECAGDPAASSDKAAIDSETDCEKQMLQNKNQGIGMNAANASPIAGQENEKDGKRDRSQSKRKESQAGSRKKSKDQISLSPQRKDTLKRDAEISNSVPSSVKKEYTISEALKRDKQPLALQTLAKRASHDADCSDAGASGGEPKAGSRPNSARAVRALSPTGHAVMFSSGNPSVENIEGIVHLYRDHELFPASGEEPHKSEMICFMGVPARMTSHDVIQFLAPVQDWIEHIKVIRDSTPNQYMLLVKFRTPKNAWDFYKNFNSKPYNSVEKDLCQLAFVSRLEAVKSEEGAGLPIAGLVELPVCPVCLERMDESVNGILTVQCNHSFHTACLAHWEDTSCPVCRFAQTPEGTADNACFECQSQESLWICLVCGHVGCGRYVQRHAFTHFQETNHTYAMQLNNNRVWDYAGDNYVHRLVQNKSDGKMVEVDERGNVVEDEKLDSLALEYTYLVNTQMESQRHYFEDKIMHIEKEALTQIEQLETKNKQMREQHVEAEKRAAMVKREKQGVDKKLTQLNQKLTQLQGQFDEEKELNRSLQENQAQWAHKVRGLEEHLGQKDQEIEDLREQLRDVMFYLEAGQKLANSTDVSQEEIQQGQVVVGTSQSGRRTRKKGR